MYRIRRAAELAGVSPELLRAWERRYALVAPVRTESGYRMYSEQDVLVLRGAKRLVEGGQSIADVARLPLETISAAAAVPNAPIAATNAGMPPSDAATDLQHPIQDALVAIAAFDQERLEATLFRVMGLGNLTPEDVCDKFLLPLLNAIGDEWEHGRMTIAAEHFGSGIIRAKILRLIEHERVRGNATAVVCACPAGEEHEGALLAFSVVASRSGFRLIYLGANTPAEDIVNAAERTGASVVALSVTKDLAAADVFSLVTHLERWRAAAAHRQVLVGGRGAVRNRAALELAGLHVAERIDAGLATIAIGSAP